MFEIKYLLGSKSSVTNVSNNKSTSNGPHHIALAYISFKNSFPSRQFSAIPSCLWTEEISPVVLSRSEILRIGFL